MDEHLISELKRQGAQISMWGVGTHLVTGKEQSALDGVYKLSAIRSYGGEWKDKLKLSEQMVKISNPGILQVKRFYRGDRNVADVLYDIRHPINQNSILIDPLDPTRKKVLQMDLECYDLLSPIFREGKLVYDLLPLAEIRTQDARKPQKVSFRN